MSSLLKQHKNFIPLIILGVCCICTFLNSFFNKYEGTDGIVYGYTLKIEHWLGLVAVITDFLIYFFKRKYFKYAIIITVVFGLVNLLIFLPFNVSLHFFISVQALSFLIGLVYVFLNYGTIYKKGIKEAEQLDTEKVEKLKLKYLEMSNEELLEIYEDKRFTAEAKLAVEKLLEERHKS